MTSGRPRDPLLEAFMKDPGRRADPYPTFHHLQERDPVYYPALRAWFVTRYTDVQAILAHSGASSCRGISGLRDVTASAGPDRPFARWDEMSMINRDPPDHTRLRRFVNRAFTGPAVTDLRGRVERVAADLLDPVVEQGTMDLVSGFAYPLPLVVIGDLIGVPVEDRARFATWAASLAPRYGVDPQRTPAVRRAGDQAITEITDYFDRLADQRRRKPCPDLISSLVAAADSGAQLSTEDVIATCVLLVNAGHETTANLIANGALALLGHPAQVRQIHQQGTLTKTAVDELLRYDTSVQLVSRVLTQDLPLGDVVVAAGQRVFLMLGAANRDPSRFAEPDQLELTRPDNQHLAFGWGAHYCVGATLARLEIDVALTAVFTRFSDLALADSTPQWRDNLTLRGLTTLPVRWSPVSSRPGGPDR